MRRSFHFANIGVNYRNPGNPGHEPRSFETKYGLPLPASDDYQAFALLAIRMPGRSGIEVLAESQAHDADADVSMVNSVEGISITLDAMGQGGVRLNR